MMGLIKIKIISLKNNNIMRRKLINKVILKLKENKALPKNNNSKVSNSLPILYILNFISNMLQLKHSYVKNKSNQKLKIRKILKF